MLYDRGIVGKYIQLRSVLPKDAQFVIDLRNDKSKNMFLHETSTDVQKQIDWIRSQNDRIGDYYFVIENDKGAIGLVSLYGIDEEKRSAEFGRWISNGNALENVETVIQLLDFGFNQLSLCRIYMLTMVDNKRVCNFWKSFGATIGEQIVKNGLLVEQEIIDKEDYLNLIRPKNTKLLRY